MNRGSDSAGQNLLFLPKSTLLHQSKAFNAPQLDVGSCTAILTAILFQLGQGERFTKDESTSLFFSCTKLFQCKDLFLRRLVYCLIRALQPTPDDAVIIISCLSKDVNSTNQASDVCRSNAARLLFSLIDEAMIQNIERLLTQTLIDTNPVLIKSSLLAAQHVYRYSVDAVRRWKLEINKSLNHQDQVIAYHALSLATKTLTSQNDHLGFSRFVTNNIKSSPSHGKRLLPTIYELRTISSLMKRHQTQSGGALADPAYSIEWLEFLRDCLGDNNQIGIQIEAMKIVFKFLLHTNRPDYCNFLTYALSMLVNIISKQSSTIIHKFAAFRLLNDVAQNKTELLTPHANAFDSLLSTTHSNPILQNRTLAMLAINISLKAGNEGNIEYFLSALENVLASSPDEQKLSILFNLRDYILYKNSKKFVPIVAFMSLLLKDENKFVIKNAIITIFQQFLFSLPESTPVILDTIAEHIEDSEYPRVTLKIINMIGQYAYRHPTRPEKYIRYLFNRTMLESASIRATAVSAIVRIGLSTQSFNIIPTPINSPAPKQLKRQIRQTILSLLLTVCYDSDDEVRDRARLYIDLLKRMMGTVSAPANLDVFTTQANPIGLFIDSSQNQPPVIQELHNPKRYLDRDAFPTFPMYAPNLIAAGGTPTASAEIPILPDLDTLEAGVLNYLQSNFNINTSSSNLPPNTPALPIQTASSTSINTSSTSSTVPTSSTSVHAPTAVPAPGPTATSFESDFPTTALASPFSFFYNEYVTNSKNPAPLPPPPHRLFDPIVNTQNNPLSPFSSHYVTSLYDTSSPHGSKSTPGSSNATTATSQSSNQYEQLQGQQHHTHQTLNNGELSTAQSIEELTQRGCPQPVIAFLSHNNITNIWHSQFDINSTTPQTQQTQAISNNTPGSKSTEFPSIINHYIFPNGSILFETTVRHNFTNAVVNGMVLQIDELTKLHEQGHISLHCMSTASNNSTTIGDSNNNISQPPTSPTNAANAPLEFGQTRTLYTFFTIKQLSLLINLCSLQYQYKLRYMVTLDGEVEKGEYLLYRAALLPQLFISPPSQYQQRHQQVKLYEFDYKQYWDQLAQGTPNQTPLPAEITTSYSISIDPSLLQNSSTNPQSISQAFLQKVTSLLSMFATDFGLEPSTPQFNVQSLAGQTQVLVNLFGVYLAPDSTNSQTTSPTKILSRFGAMFQPQTGQILIKVMMKTPNPHLTKLLSGSIKI